jgi:serine-type D-Ala-D-Ala carboxypeptidase/endopeptidase (penicillin-binding protein 4)
MLQRHSKQALSRPSTSENHPVNGLPIPRNRLRGGLSRVLKNLIRLTFVGILGIGAADIVLLTRNFGAIRDTQDDRTDVPTQTPLLSARRVPDLLAEIAGGSAISGRVNELFNNERMGNARAASCVVVRQAGRTLVSENATLGVLPASTMKLITATAVLDKFQTTDTFSTRVMATAAAAGDTLTGDLHLVGGGDPLLATADYVATTATAAEPAKPATSLEELADRVAALGIKKITGDVIGDDRLFDGERAIPSWKESYTATGEVGPLTALMVNNGFVKSSPVPTRKRKATSGTKTQGTWKATDDPAASAATTFGQLLLARGITIDGTTRSAKLGEPAASVELASIKSLPVEVIVGEMLSRSDNTTAEMMVKHLSLTKDKSPASTVQGLQVIVQALRDHKIETKDLTLVDGSGLDRGDRVTCSVLVQAIESAPEELRALLPVAGETGTLAERMKSDALRGKVRAKTGTLNGVSALVGDIATQGGGTVEFALVLNELPAGVPGVATGDELATVVVAYPQYVPIPPVIPTTLPGAPPTTLTAAQRRNTKPRAIDVEAIQPPVGDNSLLPDEVPTTLGNGIVAPNSPTTPVPTVPPTKKKLATTTSPVP